MEKITLSLPQLIIATRLTGRAKYLERLTIKSGKPKVDLTFQEDSKKDSRIIAIKYQLLGGEGNNHILYYSEEINEHAIITFNLGYNYLGAVLARDYENNKMGFNLEHLPKEGLRKKHVEKINKLEEIREDLTPEYVAKRYKDFLYNLQVFTQ
jgi:hypothetical protein